MVRVLSRIALLLMIFEAASPLLARDKTRGFDVNDVTVLFPLDSADQPVPSLTLDGTLVSPGIFSSLMIEATEQWISAPEGGSILKADDWRVVGFRYDPCAPSDTRGDGTCIQELRLVAQSLGTFGPNDSSLHVIYRLGTGLPAAGDEILEDLLALRKTDDLTIPVTTAGEPLAVHPILSAALMQGNEAVLDRYVLFIRKYAKTENLQKLTMMGLRDGSPLDWIFLGGIIENGRWQPSLVPNVGNGQRTMVELNLAGGSEVFRPLAKDYQISMERFFNNNVQGVNENLTDLDRASHTIENPQFSNRNTVDCVSCHSATSVRLTGQFKFSPFLPGVSAKIPTRITAFPGPQMLTSHPAHWNLRALGYFGLQPSITMRTVHESARVAETLNAILKLDPPGRDCSLVSEKVMACFVDSSRLFGTVLPKESCLKSCQL